jgi:RimJ/RimL family protein N-acetyltransferase
MMQETKLEITFARLSDVPRDEIFSHMSDPRVAEHMPLITSLWDKQAVSDFVAAKEACWERDGLGHWAFLLDGSYIGWGGFQKEGDEWDLGLVLRSEKFGFGPCIVKKLLGFAKADERISFVTFLLPPSRKNLRGLERLGASFVKAVDYAGHEFLKYRLETV